MSFLSIATKIAINILFQHHNHFFSFSVQIISPNQNEPLENEFTSAKRIVPHIIFAVEVILYRSRSYCSESNKQALPPPQPFIMSAFSNIFQSALSRSDCYFSDWDYHCCCLQHTTFLLLLQNSSSVEFFSFVSQRV